MKGLLSIIFLILPAMCHSQNDSLYPTTNIKFNLLYVESSTNDTIKIQDLQTIDIIGDSILAGSVIFDIADLEMISFRVGNYGFWRGAKHGAVAGALVSLFTGFALDNKIDWGDLDDEGGGLLLLPMILTGGAILGSVTGGIISMSNGRYLDYKLSGTTKDYKKKELNRLMNKYGRSNN